MCGIFGYVGGGRSSADAAGIVLRGLKKLEYRGYDSWGVAVAHDGTVKLERRVGKIGEASVGLPPESRRDRAHALGHARRGHRAERAPAPRLPRAPGSHPQRDRLELPGAPRHPRPLAPPAPVRDRHRGDRAPAGGAAGAHPRGARAAREGPGLGLPRARRAERGGGAGRAVRAAGGGQERLADRPRLGDRGELPGFGLQRAARAHPPGHLPGRRSGRADRGPRDPGVRRGHRRRDRARGRARSSGRRRRPSSPATRTT